MTITTEFSISLRDPTLLDCRGLINGEWRHANNQKTFPVSEPATGSVLHPCADFGHEEFVQAINVANIGYKSFYNVMKFPSYLQLIVEAKFCHSTVAIILSLENGKTLAEAKEK
ncbi:hypothetical protein N7491_000602 [Penicillium cf. griseofulvum]|uniref:Uncharacterized protein n=1 Tax=Penicillium cf. griseofulvum TaxID=2972120 RepID=A0A9W9MEB4_9EURO|nr:hypothetical protein N7472_004037 [Penicillium cf. griseofulvum]KAJ5442766.1 hypothetical protein N7445_004517 [Penicillium cf. griseofulvum]KAJ5451420.1 hypothetical protein N7491_000602 [Penicillium cf. griseofulvum]